MTSNRFGELKSIEAWHADVDEYYSDFVSQKLLKGIPGGACLNQVFSELIEDYFVAQELRRLIIDAYEYS